MCFALELVLVPERVSVSLHCKEELAKLSVGNIVWVYRFFPAQVIWDVSIINSKGQEQNADHLGLRPKQYCRPTASPNPALSTKETHTHSAANPTSHRTHKPPSSPFARW